MWRTTLLRNIAIGRSMNMSASSAATIAKALSHPNSRSEGRLDEDDVVGGDRRSAEASHEQARKRNAVIPIERAWPA